MEAQGREDLGTRGGDWLASRAGRALLPERTPGTNWMGDWVGPRAGLDTEGTVKSLLPLPRIDRPVVQSVIRYYTD
jgi:hypothetical protein